MPAMSEPPRDLAALSVEELRAALARQRAVNTELRTVLASQAELHQAALAARDAQIAELRSQVVVLGERVAQLERQAGRDSANSSKPPSSDSPYTKKPRKPTDRSLRGRSGRAPGKQPGAPGATLAQAPDLTCANHVPVGRAARLLWDTLGVGCSVGFVAGVRGKAAGRLGPFVARVRELLRQAGVLGADETPGRAGGGLVYVHVACTEFLTHLHVGGRSADDIDAGGVLAGYTGTIVRDGYAGYAHLADALHAWCGAHGLRDLRAVWEADPVGQAWAQAMADLLVYANRQAAAARAAGAAALEAATLARIIGWYRGAATKGIADNQRRRTQAAKDGLRLARRFDRHEAMILRFATDLAVGFTNNLGELRHEVARCEWTRRREGRLTMSVA